MAAPPELEAPMRVKVPEKGWLLPSCQSCLTLPSLDNARTQPVPLSGLGSPSMAWNGPGKLAPKVKRTEPSLRRSAGSPPNGLAPATAAIALGDDAGASWKSTTETVVQGGANW